MANGYGFRLEQANADDDDDDDHDDDDDDHHHHHHPRRRRRFEANTEVTWSIRTKVLINKTVWIQLLKLGVRLGIATNRLGYHRDTPRDC